MGDDNTPEAAPVEVGDVASTVLLSPCVGGLMRTWTEAGTTQLQTLGQGPWVMMDAIYRWGLAPGIRP